jgi:bifunctional UDP-N-acetylglucosamine pyrophosphorylase / glucosamine-1-phosphate N-acetyltransferase
MGKPNFAGVLVLAAGMGKRMRSSTPKVLHEICGRPLLFHLIRSALEAATGSSIAVVVGHGREEIEAYVRGESFFKNHPIQFIVQDQPLGTGHAVRCAMESEWGSKLLKEKLPLLVLPGDAPLMTSELIRSMLAPLRSGEVLRLLSCHLDSPQGYGRVVRSSDGTTTGAITGIVEEKDATPEQREIQEVAVSTYLFDSPFLVQALKHLKSDNAQSEYYLTDVVGMAACEKKSMDGLCWKNAQDLQGVNDLWELAQAEKVLNQRGLQALARQGVRIIDPDHVRVDVGVQIEEGVRIEGGCVLTGATRIGKKSVLGPNVILKDCEIGDGVRLKAGTIAEQARVGAHTQVGPYAHLRPGTVLGENVKIGNFVELKKTQIDNQTSVAHLSYLGDAEVGKRVNIGCGFITCNFDGRVIEGQRKHRTVIEDDVFLGSDCQTVAPVRVGAGAFVASGSTITQDVAPQDLAIARAKQVNKPGYAKKLKKE